MCLNSVIMEGVYNRTLRVEHKIGIGQAKYASPLQTSGFLDWLFYDSPVLLV